MTVRFDVTNEKITAGICSGLNVYATYYFIRSAAQKDSGGCRQQRHEHCPLFASALRS